MIKHGYLYGSCMLVILMLCLLVSLYQNWDELVEIVRSAAFGGN